MPLEDLREDDFSVYGETMVLFKLEELGWAIYRPMYDRYIDLLALKIACSNCDAPFPDYNKLQCTNCNREVSKQSVTHGKKCPNCNREFEPRVMTCPDCNQRLLDNAKCPHCNGVVDLKSVDCENCGYNQYEFKFRTIQVKSSRDVDNGRNFGLTMKPKDLINDPRHFFIWFFVDTQHPDKPKYLVMSVEDFKEVMGDTLGLYSFRIAQNFRMHINKETLRDGNRDWSVFLNKFDKLDGEIQ